MFDTTVDRIFDRTIGVFILVVLTTLTAFLAVTVTAVLRHQPTTNPHTPSRVPAACETFEDGSVICTWDSPR